MKEITKKELNQRIEEIKKHCFKMGEKIIYKNFDSGDSYILCTIKTIDSAGTIWGYTFFNDYDTFGNILVNKYLYKCDTVFVGRL